MENRRTTRRNRTYLGGQIAFNNRSSTADCIVRDLTPYGAKLDFPDTVIVPPVFDLMISSRGESRRSRLVWRNATQAGVSIIETEMSAAMSVEAARLIARLRDEREKLKSRICELSGQA